MLMKDFDSNQQCITEFNGQSSQRRRIGNGTPKSVTHSGAKYKCDLCNFVTEYQSNYYRHRKHIHSGGGKLQYQCPKCQFSSGLYEELSRHSKFAHPEEYICSECGTEFSSLHERALHIQQKHGDDNQKPTLFIPKPVCSISTPVLKFQIAANGNGKTTLPIPKSVVPPSEEEGRNDNEIEESKLVIYDNNGDIQMEGEGDYDEEGLVLTEDISSAVESSPKQLTSSTSLISPKYSRNYVCPYGCGMSTRESREYLHHVRDVHGQKIAIFYCNQCNYASRFLAKIRRHEDLIHNQGKMPVQTSPLNLKKSEASPFRNGCPPCLLSRTKRKPMSLSTVVNTCLSTGTLAEKRPLIADQPQITVKKQKLDDFSFPDSVQSITSTISPSEVQPQQSVVNGSRSSDLFHCHLCKYVTTELSRYKKHLRCHQTTAPTRCNVCDFNTVYSWNLDRHLKCHEIPGKYICYRCTYSQNTRQSMTFHIQHHHIRNFSSVACQTNPANEFVDCVEVEAEVFSFEKHSVRLNADYRPDFSKLQDISCRTSSSPKVECSATSSPGSAKSDVSSDCSDDYLPWSVFSGMSDDDFGGESVDGSANADVNNSLTSLKERYFTMLNGFPASCELKSTPELVQPEEEALDLSAVSDSLKKYENLFDVNGRVCSICGYQGKWPSEMGRHMRVHLEERPFRCKYCSRTSKWKADLIRHVFNVHGIRVVTKYSRSRSLGAVGTQAVKASGNDDDIEVLFEDAVSVVEDCPSVCDSPTLSLTSDNSFNNSCDDLTEEKQAVSMADQQAYLSKLKALEVHHQSPLAPKSSPLVPKPPQLTPKPKLASPLNGSTTLPSLFGLEKYLVLGTTGGYLEPQLCCRFCPAFHTKELHIFRTHVQTKHENLKPFQCSSCGYRSNYSSDVHKHIRLKKTGHEGASVVKLLQRPTVQNPSPEMAVIGNSGQPIQLLKPLKTSAALKSLQQQQTKSFVESGGKPGGQTHWICLACKYENESRSDVVEHLDRVHGLPAFACPLCPATELYHKTCVFHMQTVHGRRDSNIIRYLDSEWRRNDVKNNHVMKPASKGVMKQQSEITNKKLLRCENQNKRNSEPLNSCGLCPFTTPSEQILQAHAKGHEKPSGLVNYKCAFCVWFAKKKVLVEEHMQLHTSNPSAYMAEVEKNLITPANMAALEGLFNIDRKQPVVLANEVQAVSPSANQVKATFSLKLPKLSGDSVNLELSDVRDIFSDFGAIIDSIDEQHSPESIAAEKSSVNSFIEDQWPVNGRRFLLPTLNNTSYGNALSVNVSSPFAQEYCLNGNPEDGIPNEIPKVSISINGLKRKVWQCRYCPHISKRRANIRMHEKKHSKQKLPADSDLMKCPKCNFLGVRSDLNNHYYSVHIHELETSVPREFPCGKCPAIFKHAGERKSHLVFHGSNMEFACNICDYATNQLALLNKHMTVHESCSTSPSSYSSNNNPGLTTELSADEDMESGVESDGLIEEEDQKKDKASPRLSEFRLQQVSNNSLLVASKPKKHQCPDCPAKFSDRTQLFRHAKFHGIQPKMKFRCHLCNYSVGYPINLRKHLKAHHGLSAIGELLNLEEGVAVSATEETGDDLEEESEELQEVIDMETPSLHIFEQQEKIVEKPVFESSASPPLRLKINLSNMSCKESPGSSST